MFFEENKVECSICYQEIEEKVFQCENGHLYCEICVNQISHCGTCRCNNYKIRNKVIEDFILNKKKFNISTKKNNNFKENNSNDIFVKIFQNYNNNISKLIINKIQN